MKNRRHVHGAWGALMVVGGLSLYACSVGGSGDQSTADAGNAGESPGAGAAGRLAAQGGVAGQPATAVTDGGTGGEREQSGGAGGRASAGAGGAAAGATSGAGAAQAGAAGAPDSAGTCWTDQQCPADQHCVGSVPARVCLDPADYCLSGADCPGGRGLCSSHRCTAALVQDAPCWSSSECALGLSCQPSQADATKRCLPSFSEGQVCDAGFDGHGQPVVGKDLACPAEAPCQLSDQIGDSTWFCIQYGGRDSRLCMYGCAPDDFCLADPGDTTPADYVCGPRVAQLGFCLYDRYCQAGLSCGETYDTSAGDGTKYWVNACIPSPKVGASCVFPYYPDDPSAGNASLTCEPGAYCDQSGVCRALPSRGDACSTDTAATTYGSEFPGGEVACGLTRRCVDSWADGHCQ